MKKLNKKIKVESELFFYGKGANENCNKPPVVISGGCPTTPPSTGIIKVPMGYMNTCRP